MAHRGRRTEPCPCEPAVVISARYQPAVTAAPPDTLSTLLGLFGTIVTSLPINAGSPLATTYGSADVVPPAFDLAVLGQYLRDMQFVLIVLAIGSTAWLLFRGERSVRQVALVVGGNLAVNLVFFLSHPIFTPYYILPIAMPAR